MKANTGIRQLMALCFIAATVLLLSTRASAHCDTMDGPVVKAAQKALETNDVNLVLIWVQQKDEGIIREAFARTMSVRKLSAEARGLADMYFFETLVRVHRAGEGVPYTGLKPAGTEVEPGIVAADNALEKGSAEELLNQLDKSIHQGIQEQFTKAMAKSKYEKGNVAAGREYVRAYVEFIHYAERLFTAASAPVEGHFEEAVRATPNEHQH